MLQIFFNKHIYFFYTFIFMKKIIGVLLVSITLFSCSKDKQCYTCTFGTSNGVTPPSREYCGPLPTTFKDANGNELQSFCTPK